MRKAQASGWMMRKQSQKLTRAAWFTAAALGIGLVMAAGPVRAADDDEDDKTFEEKIIDNIMRGLGGTNMENRGIDYRERSPLVVPPRLHLPAPGQAAADPKAPNWPKDPDEQRRKAAIEARKKSNKDPREASRLLTPSELSQGKTIAPKRGDNDPVQPGTNTNNPVLSPSQLGYTGGLGLFGGNKAETAPFKGEPARESLTQPPTGYQTPSPAFAYGTGPRESLNKQYDVMSGKER